MSRFYDDLGVEITRHVRRELNDPTLSNGYCLGHFHRFCWDDWSLVQRLRFARGLLPKLLFGNYILGEYVRGFFGLRQARRWL